MVNKKDEEINILFFDKIQMDKISARVSERKIKGPSHQNAK